MRATIKSPVSVYGPDALCLYGSDDHTVPARHLRSKYTKRGVYSLVQLENYFTSWL